MRYKSTVVNIFRHDPYMESKDELEGMKRSADKTTQKDRKQGQSDYRKRLATKKK